MYEDIMRRPMFQNAQQRASSGIMTGVAPVQGFDNGGEAYAYTPEYQSSEDLMGELSEMRGGEGILNRARKEYEGLNEEYDSYLPDIDFDNFISTEQTEPGSGLNTRDITDLLIVDPNNELDVALAGASAVLMASGLGAPAAVALTAARLGIKGKKNSPNHYALKLEVERREVKKAKMNLYENSEQMEFIYEPPKRIAHLYQGVV